MGLSVVQSRSFSKDEVQTHHVSRSSGTGPDIRTRIKSEANWQSIEERFSRRQILVGGGVVGAIALVGAWYRIIREPTPIDVIKKWWRFYEAGNLDGAREVYHSESPTQATYEEINKKEFGPGEEVSWTIENRTLSIRGKRASVRERYIWEDRTGRYRITDEINLRTEDGEWKIWARERRLESRL